jgi:hypothetical protein
MSDDTNCSSSMLRRKGICSASINNSTGSRHILRYWKQQVWQGSYTTSASNSAVQAAMQAAGQIHCSSPAVCCRYNTTQHGCYIHYITYSTQQGVGTPLGDNERLIGVA